MFQLNFQAIIPSLPFILDGVWTTLKFTFISLLCGMPFAVLLAFCKVSRYKPLIIFANFYTSIFRGTPLLVQLGLIYFGIPQLTGYRIGAFEAGILTFSLNSAAYASEVIRAGILSIDQGQWEAAFVLGFSKRQTFIHVILPQAIRCIIPNLLNEMIDLLKESALISTIGEADLMQRTKLVAAEKFLYFEPYLLAAILYYLFVLGFTAVGRYAERKLRLC